MQSRYLKLSLLFAASLSMIACAAQDEDTGSDESEVKKKVQPTGGSGVFEYKKPSWWPADNRFLNSATFGGVAVDVGGSVQRTPGEHRLVVGQMTETIPLAAGQTVSKTATGVRVRYDKPLTFGGSRWSCGNISLDRYRLNERPEGVLFLVLPFSGLTAVDSAVSARIGDFSVEEGKLKEVVLQTSRLVVQTDEYDPAFPTAPGDYRCRPTEITAGANSDPETRALRAEDGTVLGNQVVPRGDDAPIRISAYGFNVDVPTTGATTTITLNRLEVDDVEVQGTSQKVRGTYRIERKMNNGSWKVEQCSDAHRTHTGMDLPDGTYRVTSTARTDSGVITHQAEVSFP